MRAYHTIGFLFLACCLPPILAGCLGGTSPPSRFYTLAPLETRSSQPAKGQNTLMALGPVTLPDYLNRRQIVTRSGKNELVIAEFDRWGGTLDDEITRSLVANLADRLASANISVFSWQTMPLGVMVASYRVPVGISRFDGIPGESVVLSARWGIFAKKETTEESLLVNEAAITEKVDGKGYDALVAAMQRALDRLGKEMADSITARGVLKSP
jgi:uncharacterized lipoprotein YmbA